MEWACVGGEGGRDEGRTGRHLIPRRMENHRSPAAAQGASSLHPSKGCFEGVAGCTATPSCNELVECCGGAGRSIVAEDLTCR
jgi:hypothetical protein